MVIRSPRTRTYRSPQWQYGTVPRKCVPCRISTNSLQIPSRIIERTLSDGRILCDIICLLMIVLSKYQEGRIAPGKVLTGRSIRQP